MRHPKPDIPYAWFWQGRPLRRGYSRGEHITAVPLTQQFTPEPSHASRDPSPTNKPAPPQCTCELHEQTRPPMPNSGNVDNTNRAHGFGPYCHTEHEPEPAQSVKKCTCSECMRSSAPSATSVHPGYENPTPCSSRTMTPVMPFHHACAASSSRTVYCLNCLQYHHECQYLAAVPISEAQPQRAETSAPSAAPIQAQAPNPAPVPRASDPQVKCGCAHCVGMTEAVPEVESRHHGCCHPKGCRIDNYVTPAVTDDTASVFSAEMVGDSESVDEFRYGHLIIASPMHCYPE
ncbi:uncharacterized protein N7483_008449 [Penicillium malachiteum]|uniref:uncharacterized protein n=1 Tax=Penicillium malachiteum TaxID=1324776 RepID=UPI00254973A6|nr:uncharacterized protein N7483_008449 [Penicillium malachiteum]KAJ5720515.1 hypothetical protein N7483_008449 [Penicillium malachiteum]